MPERTRGIDINEVFNQIKEDFALDMSKCIVFATDGARNMTGATSGFLALQKKSDPTCAYLPFHCILHQDALCAKYGTEQLSDIITQITGIINFIKARALLHREFMNFLQCRESEFSDLVFYTEVRWLSRGVMSQRFYQLLPELREFLQEKDTLNEFPFLTNQIWIQKLAFLADFSSILNTLNKTLQGNDVLLPDAISKISAFMRKLQIFKEQFQNKDFTNFPSFLKESKTAEFDYNFYISILDAFIDQFSERFDVNSMQIFKDATAFVSDPMNFSL